MWTRPADRAPSYGPYGQGVDKCAALAHPLPTLGALATTSSPLQQLDQGQQARAPSAPSRLPGPGGRAAACSMRNSPPRLTSHCPVTKARLRSQPAGRWPAPSSTRGETTPQTREREAPPRPVRAGRNRGQITQESRSSVPGIAVKSAGIRKRALQTRRWRVALHLEQPNTKSRLRPQPFDVASVLSRIRNSRKLKAVDAHPVILDREADRRDMPWTVR